MTVMSIILVAGGVVTITVFGLEIPEDMSEA
jgi:hypothetical protein